MKKMKYISQEKIENKGYLESFVNENTPLNDNLSINDKVSYLDFKISYLQYQRTNNKIEKEEYLPKYLNLLKQRSTYNITSNYDIKAPINPLASHDSARASIFYDSADSFEIGFKPVYNDLYDINDGYLQGAYIDFFNVNFKKKNNENIKLDSFTLLKIKPLAPRDMFFKPISWGIDLGYEHFKENSDYLKVKPEVGLSFGENKDFIYMMLDSNLYYKNNDQLYSIGSSVGFITNRFDRIKLGISYSYDKYNKSLENNQFETFVSYKIHRNSALKIKYINDNLYEKQDRVKLGIFYYF